MSLYKEKKILLFFSNYIRKKNPQFFIKILITFNITKSITIYNQKNNLKITEIVIETQLYARNRKCASLSEKFLLNFFPAA